MPDDMAINAVLTELDGFANAPLTTSQRVSRAGQALSVAELSLADLTQALSRDDLQWKRNKATAFGVMLEQWQEALNIARISESTDIASLLDALHRADSAAAMLRSGYRATRDVSGKLNWTR
jgi:hypothetical protein